MSDFAHIPVLVPEGKDATDLTLAELDKASYHLKADVLTSVNGGQLRYAAFAEIAFQWARRSHGPEAKRETYRDYTFDELCHALRMDEEDDDDPKESSDESSAFSSPPGSDASQATSTE